MQIILASAKIMNDKLKSVPDISLSTPRFMNEAQAFAKDMAWLYIRPETWWPRLSSFYQAIIRNRQKLLAEKLRECLDTVYVVGCAARFPTAMHGQDGITHIDTTHGYRRSKDVA